MEWKFEVFKYGKMGTKETFGYLEFSRAFGGKPCPRAATPPVYPGAGARARSPGPGCEPGPVLFGPDTRMLKGHESWMQIHPLPESWSAINRTEICSIHTKSSHPFCKQETFFLPLSAEQRSVKDFFLSLFAARFDLKEGTKNSTDSGMKQNCCLNLWLSKTKILLSLLFSLQ